MEDFMGTKNRNAIIKRMIEIGLIAERAEILQKNIRKSNATAGNDSDEEMDDYDENAIEDIRPIKIVSRRKNLSTKKYKNHTKLNTHKINIQEIRKYMGELNEDLRDNLDWVCESLNDAATDAEDCSEDPDDGVPLVPFSSKQRDALEDDTFRKLLLAVGLQIPAQNAVNSNCLGYNI